MHNSKRKKSLLPSGNAKIRALHNFSFSSWKADSWSSPQIYFLFFWIVPAFLKELIGRVLGLLVPLLELNRFEILLDEQEEGRVTYLVASLTLDRARSCVMQVTSFAQGKVSNIPTVHIVVAVVLVVVVVVVVDSSIIKLSFVIIGGATKLAKECDRKRACFLGGKISLGRKKSRGSNYGDNTGDRGRAIGAGGGGIDGSSEVSKKVFPGEAGEYFGEAGV
nr:hypothetical protein [Tanacetum cinerariifolium]